MVWKILSEYFSNSYIFTSYSILTLPYLISLLIYCSNILASKAADSLNACANKLTLSSYKNKEEIFLRTPDQVPLLQCRILMGSSIGRCYITAQQIFLVTQQIPIIGGSMCRIYSLADIEIKVHARPSSILSRLPASVSIVKEIIK